MKATRVRIRGRLCAIAAFCLSTQCSLHAQVGVIRPPGGEGGVAVTINNLSEPSILQRSWDMQNWSDVMFLWQAYPGESVTDPASALQRSGSYRLRPAASSGTRRAALINISPADPYLGSLKFGNEFEIQLFGTRDSNGDTAEITHLTYRVGNTLYHSLPPDSAVDAARSVKSPVRSSAGSNPQFEFVRGLVDVRRGPGCPIPLLAPRLQFVASMNEEHGATQEISGTRETFISEVTETVVSYQYDLPVFSTGDFNWTPNYERARVAFWAGVRALLPDGLDPFTITLRAYSDMLKLGTASPKFFSWLGHAANAYVFVEAGGESWEETFHTYTLEGRWSIDRLKIRAVIPSSDGHFSAASPWIEYGPSMIPFYPEPGDTLVIDAPCDARIVALAEGSHVRTHCSVIRGNTIYSEKTDFVPSLQALSCETHLDVREPDFGASISAAFKAVIGGDLLTMRGSTLSTGVRGQQTRTYEAADGKIRFRVSPTSTFTDGATIVLKLEMKWGGSAGGQGSVSAVGQPFPLVRLTSAGSTAVSLQVGMEYFLEHYSIQQGNDLGETGSTALTLTLLGAPIE